MVLAVPTRAAIKLRLRQMRMHADVAHEMTVRKASRKMEQLNGKPVADKLMRGESLTYENIMIFCKAVAGTGNLLDDEEAIHDYIMRGGDQRNVLVDKHLIVTRFERWATAQPGDEWVARESNPEPTDSRTVAYAPYPVAA